MDDQDQSSPPTPDVAVVKNVDAVEFLPEYKSSAGSMRPVILRAEAKSLLGVPKIYERMHAGTAFVTGDIHDSLLFPKWHPRTGDSRYEWTDRVGPNGKADGVRLGVFVDGAKEAVGSVASAEWTDASYQ